MTPASTRRAIEIPSQVPVAAGFADSDAKGGWQFQIMPVVATWPTPSTLEVVNGVLFASEAVVATVRPTRVAPELVKTSTVVALHLFPFDPTATKSRPGSPDPRSLLLGSNWYCLMVLM